MGPGETVGGGERGFGDAGTETENPQLGKLTSAEAEDTGAETGDAQVGGGTRVQVRLQVRWRDYD